MINEVDEVTFRFGKTLQEYREKAKITQQEMANAAGLTKNYISAIERGIHKCNAQTFIVYATMCDVSLDEIAGRNVQNHINGKLLRKISEMSEEEQERALKILELMR